MELFILFFVFFFTILTEGYNFFLPFYMEKLEPSIEEDLLNLRVNELSVTLKVNTP